jgi:hypothetical protein
MRQKTVDEILLPYREGIPLHPSVVMGDKITHAVELMLKSNLKYIAVVRNQTPVGMLRLEDAFQRLGLRLPKKGHG